MVRVPGWPLVWSTPRGDSYCRRFAAASSSDRLHSRAVDGSPLRKGAVAITIHDVARRAGVSVTTVSRALTEPRLVRKSTLARVLAAAKQLAYRPNPAARSLITGKTGNIGIVVPDLENPFYTSISARRTGPRPSNRICGAPGRQRRGPGGGGQSRPHDDQSGRRRDHLLALCRRRPARAASGSDVARPHQSRAAGHRRRVDGFGQRHAQGGRPSCRAGSSPLRLPRRPAQCLVEPRAACAASARRSSRTAWS